MRILFQMSGMKRLLLRWYEHPLLQSSTSKIHQDTQTSLWSRGNEIHHSGISGWDQRTRREGRSTHRISYEFEQELLKHIHNLKKDLREKGWWERETPEFSQTSFLRSENSDAELSFKFEWCVSWELSLHGGYICATTSNWELGLDWFINFISISVYAIC